MSIIVQKYGGSSVATEEKLRHVAERIVATRRQGHQVVAVVSAMGNTTSELLDQARSIGVDKSRRELDMLLSCGERISMSLLSMTLQSMGEEAISLTGPQCGVRTTDTHFNARIENVNPERVHAELDAGRIVVAAGYQGANATGEVTTLGRGGSDTTAVAIAAALKAERCEIYSDVDGVYSADPRVVEAARPLAEISYEEMTEMARHGASVLNPRAVEYAWKRDVTIQARCTFNDKPGTVIHQLNEDAEPSVAGVACHKELVWLSLRGRKDVAELGEVMMSLIGKADVFLDKTNDDGERRDVLVPAGDIADADSFSEQVHERYDGRITVSTEIGSVSAVGLGVGNDERLLLQAQKAIEKQGIDVLASFTGEHSLTCLVDRQHVGDALRLLHRAFVEESIGTAREVA